MLNPLARADKLSHKDTKQSAQTLPLLPLRGVVVFPRTTLPLEVGRDKSVVALEEAMSCGKLIVLAAQKVAKVNEPSPDDIYTVGTVSEIKQLVRLPDGTIRVVVEGVERAVILDYVHSDPSYVVRVEPMPTVEVHDPEMEALARNALREFEQYVKLSKKIPVEILLAVAGSNQPGKLADDIAAHMPLKIEDKHHHRVGYTQCANNVADKIRVARSIDEVDLVVLPLHRGYRGVNGAFPLDLVWIVIHRRSAVIHLAKPIHTTAQIEHSLGKSSLTSAAM